MGVKRTKYDILFSDLIRSRGYCERCSATPPNVQLQCAHIVSRRYAKTRTDFRNAYCLCAGCHRYFTDNPREFSNFIDTTWAKDYYDKVFRLAHDTVRKINWQDRHEHLLDAKRLLKDRETTLEELRDYEESYWEALS